MKKNLLALIAFSICTLATRADVVLTETFNYSNGPVVQVGTNANGTTNWFRHSGNANPSDSIVRNHRIEVSATGGTVSRQDDVHCNFSSFTNTQTILYSSFVVNCTNLPPTVGTYFAHFYVNSTTFHGRVFAQSGSLSNTWRLGISGANGAVSRVFPVDLAPNTDYQIVVQWDPVTSFSATLWVNPVSSGDASVFSSDGVTSPAASVGYGFRQASSFGNTFLAVSNLVVATTFDEAATNVMSTNATSPVVITQPKGGTNFVGDSVNLIALATGQGLGSLTYQWQKNGADVSNGNGNSNVLNIASASASDSGNYTLVVTTPYNQSTTSAVATLWVTNAPVPPTISQQPASVSTYYHQSATLHVVASGPPPLSYQWYYTNAPATSPNVSGADTDTLTISDVFTNNDTAGPYYVVVSNPYGSKTSSVATVTAAGPPAVSIAFLRTLVDPISFNATNSNLRWQATGIVTSSTNLTTGDTSSYYLQDGTAGINIFVTRGHDFRPQLGDVVTFIGWLSSFNSTLELEADTNDVSTSFTIWSNNIAALPAPKVIPMTITNNLPFVETNLEGSIVMLTNVYFTTNTITSSNANTTVTVTNLNGDSFVLLFSSQDLDVVGLEMPNFAWTVSGPLTQNLGNGVSPRNQGYQIAITRPQDIVTNAPAAPTLSVAKSGNTASITWSAIPYQYSYSVQAASDINGPFTTIASGLTFTNSTGVYVDAAASASPKFYRVLSP